MEKNYWAIHMGENNRYADVAYENNFIGVGWNVIPDLTNFRNTNNRQFKDKINPLLEKAYPDKSINAKGQIIGQLYRFGNLMNLGDIVLVPNTQEGKVYAGFISSEYFHETDAGEQCPHQHRRKVKWLKVLNWDDVSRELKNTLGSIMTTFSVSDHWEEIEKLLAESDAESGAVENYEEFGLESHLEDFLVENWERLKLGEKYDIFKEDNQVVGQQYVTPIGRIDILARAKDNNGWLVIELKKGKDDDRVVGQTLRYIGWVAESLAEKEEDVKGLIITKEKDDKLMYALRALNNVSFMTYSVKFDLKEEK